MSKDELDSLKAKYKALGFDELHLYNHGFVNNIIEILVKEGKLIAFVHCGDEDGIVKIDNKHINVFKCEGASIKFTDSRIQVKLLYEGNIGNGFTMTIYYKDKVCSICDDTENVLAGNVLLKRGTYTYLGMGFSGYLAANIVTGKAYIISTINISNFQKACYDVVDIKIEDGNNLVIKYKDNSEMKFRLIDLCDNFEDIEVYRYE